MKRKPEQWKTIKNYPNYMISSWGRVWSKPHSTKFFTSAYGGYWITKHYKGHMLKATKRYSGVNNYLMVGLCNKGKIKLFLVHRLVAEAFLPNPHHYSDVNHINECKFDDYVGNLEWCTHAYNNAYSYYLHSSKRRPILSKAAHLETKPVILFHTSFDAYYFSSCQKAYYFVTGVWRDHWSFSEHINHGYKFHGWNILQLK